MNRTAGENKSDLETRNNTMRTGGGIDINEFVKIILEDMRKEQETAKKTEKKESN